MQKEIPNTNSPLSVNVANELLSGKSPTIKRTFLEIFYACNNKDVLQALFSFPYPQTFREVTEKVAAKHPDNPGAAANSVKRSLQTLGALGYIDFSNPDPKQKLIHSFTITQKAKQALIPTVQLLNRYPLAYTNIGEPPSPRNWNHLEPNIFIVTLLALASIPANQQSFTFEQLPFPANYQHEDTFRRTRLYLKGILTVTNILPTYTAQDDLTLCGVQTSQWIQELYQLAKTLGS